MGAFALASMLTIMVQTFAAQAQQSCVRAVPIVCCSMALLSEAVGVLSAEACESLLHRGRPPFLLATKRLALVGRWRRIDDLADDVTDRTTYGVPVTEFSQRKLIWHPLSRQPTSCGGHAPVPF